MVRLVIVAACASGLLLPAPARADEPTPVRTRWEAAVEAMPVVTGDAAAPAAGPPAFRVPAGFLVERLFVVPQAELGSWVCLATDGAGRLIASDQNDKGLVRITPAALDGSRPTVVERLPVPISQAQGLLWAFDALYVVRNERGESGLYRVTDADGDGMLDAVEKLRGLDGKGEHGPHAIRLSPDGTRLFVICGNYTPPPFAVENVTPPQTMGGIRKNQRRIALAADGASRLPAAWDEDLIIPRLWDAGGHAVGILAPGGYVASTDRDGKAWELWAAGFRNPYDFAFNADGEIFVYDADMEWDFGMPWYRPTRVNHATSGGEFGWRSGSGKWPPCFPDSLPPMVDLGPGSPVGVTFGYGARFPSRYQRALFVCDWTFGTMYAIHLEPAGSTYRATKEQFLSRTPLPLTDAVVAADGAIYFTVGGRGGQSELYRVRYAGPEPTTLTDARDARHAAERAVRHELEALHRRVEDPAAAVAKALPHLASPDRFIRYAARVALEHQPLAAWQDRALAAAEPRARIAAAIAVARQAEPAARSAVLAALDAIAIEPLDVAERIDLARAYELAIVRLGMPTAADRGRIVARFGPLFPAGNLELDREVSSLLVALRAPGIVSRLCGLLAAPNGPASATNLAADEDELREIIGRNAGYGGAVRAALDKRSDLIQVHYAYVLRTVRNRGAWTAADREAYHAWFRRANGWSGDTFRRYLAAIEAESVAGLGVDERLALEARGLLERWVPPPLPKPAGPGRAWTAEEVMEAAATGLAVGRNFERGKQAFAAARCVVCHRFGVDGGATGPDLTQAGGRFQVKDLVEAIVHPSKVVSDQYKASIVQTADGRVVTGRIVSESPETLVVVTDPEDAAKAVEISRSDVEEIVPATESLMPKGLLDPLNETEVLDLLAYCLCRGDKNDPRFKPAPPR
jgi:putative heme-binding domain-containing protein